MTERTRRQRRKAERPQEIMTAAVELFSAKGFASTQMQEIATRAGVAKATVYLYFKTKHELFEEIVRANASPLLQRLEALLQHHPDSAAELLGMVLDLVSHELVDSPTRRAVIRVLISEGQQFPELVAFYHREVMQLVERLLQQVLAQGQACGEFRDGPALAEPRVVIGPTVLATVWRLTFDAVSPIDMPQFLQAHLDLVLHGLLKR